MSADLRRDASITNPENNTTAAVRPFAPWLAPLEPLYRSVVGLRNLAYDRGLFAVHQVDARVLSVGNLVAGGAGKTPLTMALAERLLAHGRRVAVILRGYRGRAEHAVTAIAPGSGAQADPDVFGDEAVLIARRVPQVLVVVGADRVRAAVRAVEEFGADTLLLDDGFQHRRLHRDVDLLLLRAPWPFGNGHCLPAGMLREPPSSLRRAHALVLNSTDGELWEPLPEDLVAGRPVIEVRGRIDSMVDLCRNSLQDTSALAGKRVILVTAVARPDSVEHTLRSLGAQVVHRELRRDHHPWSIAELDALATTACRLRATVVTTEKDAVKWRRKIAGSLALRLTIDVVHGGADLDRLLGLC
ncbi:MAG: tetraacyldisaccharide 4'-kinase [Pseudomonadota bacterium]